MKNLKRLFPEGKLKAVTLSYDDGAVYDRRLVEIMNRYELKGTFHLNGWAIGSDDWHVKAEEASRLYEGHEISLHTATHPRLEQLSAGEGFVQIAKDREILEKIAGYPVTGMSYPYGSFDQAVVDMLKAVGIEYCRTAFSTGNYGIPSEFLKWNPTCHDKELEKYALDFVNLKPNFMSLLYVWGHSFEFERQNRWEYIEKQFSLISCKDDVWYATNIEICRYLKASRSLITTFDTGIVYNPCAISVWIEVDGSTVEIKPGETKSL